MGRGVIRCGWPKLFLTEFLDLHDLAVDPSYLEITNTNVAISVENALDYLIASQGLLYSVPVRAPVQDCVEAAFTIGLSSRAKVTQFFPLFDFDEVHGRNGLSTCAGFDVLERSVSTS